MKRAVLQNRLAVILGASAAGALLWGTMMAATADWSGEHGSAELGLIRELLGSLPAYVAYVAGPDLVFRFANDRSRRAAGGRELIGRPYREALPEIAGQPRFEALRRVFETGEPHHMHEEEVRLRGDGSEPEPIYVDSVYQPVHNAAGRVAGVLLFGVDVSAHVRDRHRLEELAESLARSEQQYRALFETLPHGVIHYERDGSVVAANPAATELLGLAPDEMTPENRAGQTFREDGTPFRPDEIPSMVAMRTGAIVSSTVARISNRRTGQERWVRIIAVPDARDVRGRPRRAYSLLTDITGQRRAEADLRESNRLLGLLREANVLGVVVATETGIQEANDAFLDIIGYTREDLRSGRLTWDVITPPEWAHVDDEAIEQLRSTGTCPPYEKEHLRRDGRRVPTLVGAALLDRNPLRWAKFVVDLSARQRGEQERAELRAREQAARVEAGNARERLALLLGAGNLVAATASRRELLDEVAQLVVPALSDHAVVYLPTAQGTLRAASVVDRDAAKAAILEGMREIDLPPVGPLLPQMSFSKVATRVVADVNTALTDLPSPAPEVTRMIRILRRVNFASGIATPLLIGQRPVGVLVLGRYRDRPGFTETDVPVISELARRLAAGLANVETFAREHTVAETLQNALLPDAPYKIAGLDLAARYLPAIGGLQVGGDWYDVFPVGRGRVGLVIGDVAGHSISSASVMGQIRSLLRAYALEHPAPTEVLNRTNAATYQLLPEAVATAFYAVLDPATGDLSYANAGHPPPLLDTGDGHTEFLDASPGAMLGASAAGGYPVSRRQIPPGARLLLYTDGLIEDRKRHITEGLSALARAMRHSAASTAEQTIQSVQTALLGTGTRADDVCILAIHRQDRQAREQAPGC